MIRNNMGITGYKAAIIRGLCVMALLLCHASGMAQVHPPRPISVYHNPSYGLRFGAIFQNTTGGTLTVWPDNSRTSTGGVLPALLGFAYGAATFEIQANPGTIISVVNGPDVTLTGSAGGTMNLHVGGCSPVSPFITTVARPGYTTVYVGGVLTVASPTANPEGTYSGYFLVTFMQE